MADDADYATDHAETILNAKLSTRVVYVGESEEFCEDCGEPIPEKRRKEVAGCDRCFFCQTKLEAAAKHRVARHCR